MDLPSPVTIQPPAYTRSNGEVRIHSPITLTELDITIIDNAKRRSCAVRVRPCPYLITLWSGDAYDEAGDYTQAEVEERVLEALGSDIKAGLENLFQLSPRVARA
jgi:hypothetical protein